MGKGGETLRICPWSSFRLMGAGRQVNYTNMECCGEGVGVGLVLKAAKMSEPRGQWKGLRIFQQGGRSAQCGCVWGRGEGVIVADGGKCCTTAAGR